jgi:hypothetical protein
MPADPVNNDQPMLTFGLVGNDYQLRELQTPDFGVQLVRVTPQTTTKKISAVENGSTQGGQH